MQIIRVKEVAEMGGFSTATVWRKVRLDPTFPRPVKVSENVTGWSREEVEAYLQARIDESRNIAA